MNISSLSTVSTNRIRPHSEAESPICSTAYTTQKALATPLDIKLRIMTPASALRERGNWRTSAGMPAYTSRSTRPRSDGANGWPLGGRGSLRKRYCMVALVRYRASMAAYSIRTPMLAP